MKDFFQKHKMLFSILGLTLVCYLAFVHNIGSFPLLDSDETRYADMSRTMLNTKDFITLTLDGKIFWDKPPLYFWIESLSIYLFKASSEFAIRFPNIICAAIPCFMLYFIGKKLISNRFGLISALILMTSVEYVVFSKIAILDMVMTTFITVSTLCGIMTYFVQEKNKKYLWWAFYAASAIGVLAKGIPSVVIPFGTMFFIGLWKKNLKEFFKPVYILPGIALFLLISLPWHILMYKQHGMTFINEYIVKHHLMRFVGSKSIGRMHSIWYFIPVFLIGFLPWTLSFIASGIDLFKNKKQQPIPDFIVMNLIAFVFTFVFFSSARTKLITYILPLYPFSAIVCAYIWDKYIKDGSYKKSLNGASYFLCSIFIIFGLLIIFMKFFISAHLYNDIKTVQFCLSAIFIISGTLGLLALKFNKRAALFSVFVACAIALSSHSFSELINVWYKFGQNDLMSYANYAREHKLKLAALYLWERYSLQYYYNGDVVYFTTYSNNNTQYVQTKNFNDDFRGYVLVVEHKLLESMGDNIHYKVIKRGRRYDLIYDDNHYGSEFPEHR